jgi:hypothetical protein
MSYRQKEMDLQCEDYVSNRDFNIGRVQLQSKLTKLQGVYF